MYRSIGDIIVSFPTLSALKATFPHARVDMVVDEAFSEICYAHPCLDYVIKYEKNLDDDGKLERTVRELRFVLKIRRQGYDMVVDLHCDSRSALLALLSGAKYRLGHVDSFKHKFFYNMSPVLKPKGPHSVEAMMNIISPLKPKTQGKRSLFLSFSNDDRDYVENFLGRHEISKKDTVVMVHPGARLNYKRLPAQKMGELVRWMTTELGVKVIYAGSDNDLPAIADIVSFSDKPGLMAINLSLGRLSALIKSCSIFIGNDSGPMHMASALGVSIVAFFGPSNPAIWSPWGARGKIVRCKKMPCMPCGDNGCQHIGDHCMTRIKMSDIKRAIMGTIEMSALAGRG